MKPSIIFLIESGKALDMVKGHIADRIRVHEEIREILMELGVERVSTHPFTGALTGVVFPGDLPEGWTKPDRKHHLSRPKRGTDWARRFAALKGWEPEGISIAKGFDIPTWTGYTCKGGGHGGRCIGNPFTPCGWLYLSQDGPFAMWIPDVQAELAAMRADGMEPEKSVAEWKPEIPGCRRIEDEEWDILAAQHKLAEKRATAGQEAAT